MESADAYVFALPHEALLELLPEEAKRQDPAFENAGKIKVSPITGVHFWFDREVMREPFVTLLDTTTQWIFNKTAVVRHGRRSGDKGQYLQLVISASYDLLPKSRQEIIDLVPERSQTGAAGGARCKPDEGYGHQRNRGHFFSGTGSGPVASKSTDENP